MHKPASLWGFIVCWPFLTTGASARFLPFVFHCGKNSIIRLELRYLRLESWASAATRVSASAVIYLMLLCVLPIYSESMYRSFCPWDLPSEVQSPNSRWLSRTDPSVQSQSGLQSQFFLHFWPVYIFAICSAVIFMKSLFIFTRQNSTNFVCLCFSWRPFITVKFPIFAHQVSKTCPAPFSCEGNSPPLRWGLRP